MKRESGAFVSTAIDKYIYITANPKFDHKIRASYPVTEIVDRIDQLQHELIREAVYLLRQFQGLNSPAERAACATPVSRWLC
jgi:D-glycero-alpha-D-manno-heptose-7-phosphate kinase